jgi:crossover junction endodeoxyribonuclease RusA
VKKNRLVLDLPWPPSANHYWGRTKFGRTYIGKKGKEFRERVKEVLIQHLPHCKKHYYEGKLAVVVNATVPDRRRRDMDNIHKALWDALKHAGAYEDDSQICCKMVNWFIDDPVPGGKLTVMITNYNGPVEIDENY